MQVSVSFSEKLDNLASSGILQLLVHSASFSSAFLEHGRILLEHLPLSSGIQQKKWYPFSKNKMIFKAFRS